VKTGADVNQPPVTQQVAGRDGVGPNGSAVSKYAAAVKLLAAVLGAMLFTAVLLTGVLFIVGRADFWQPFSVATGVSLLAAVLSVVPIVLSLGKGPTSAAVGHFIATGVRVVVSLGGCFLAIRFRDLPAAPTLLLMVPYYFAVLIAESTMLARFIRSAQPPKQAGPESKSV